ncbi:hypothetical protein CCR95_01815 [Thiocystis minor]|nr:hypothetical protein [Thiocystis minor]
MDRHAPGATGRLWLRRLFGPGRQSAGRGAGGSGRRHGRSARGTRGESTGGQKLNTTLVALAESALLELLLHLVQAREELAVNQAGYYTLVNLINRLYAGR